MCVLTTNGAGHGPAKRLAIGKYVPFTPFFFILLGLPADLRCKPDNIFHRTAMQAMWPEVLQAPLNPAKP